MKLRMLMWILLCGNMLTAQELVVNGNFEHENVCTEYRQTCSPQGWRNAAHLPFGYQSQPAKAHEGIHYLPMVVEDVGVFNFRTYWQTKLRCPLQKGVTYKISFYAGAWGAKFIPENLGMHFSPSEVRQMRVWPLSMEPSIQFSNKNAVAQKKSPWLKVEVTYTANGNEEFLVVGNFRTDDEMIRHRKPSKQKVTYCIDELSVRRADNTAADCELSPETEAWLAERSRHTPLFQQQPVVKKPAPPPVEKKPETRIDTLVLQDVLFKFDSGSLTSDASQVLDTIVNRLQRTTYKSIRVEGHTDSLGTDAYNLDLSGRRARSVMEYFSKKGMNTSGMAATGKGEAYPVAPNSNEDGRRRNRRVEILIEY